MRIRLKKKPTNLNKRLVTKMIQEELFRTLTEQPTSTSFGSVDWDSDEIKAHNAAFSELGLEIVPDEDEDVEGPQSGAGIERISGDGGGPFGFHDWDSLESRPGGVDYYDDAGEFSMSMGRESEEDAASIQDPAYEEPI